MQLDAFAKCFGIARVYYKDEAKRFGLGSFKALGALNAVQSIASEKIARFDVGNQDGSAGAPQQITEAPTFVCATDGNYGRGVAWASNREGCNSVVFIADGVSRWRESEITRFGAKVVRIPGVYEDALSAAEQYAKRYGWIVVSDTAYPGCLETPKRVMAGYAVLVDEVVEQLPQRSCPSHVFLQVGVGGLAAAVIIRAAHLWSDKSPKFIIVEPERADCAYQSALHGELTDASGDLATISAGLACGRLSSIAWPVLKARASAFMTLSDAVIVEAMQALATRHHDCQVTAGESGCVGFAALREASKWPEFRHKLSLSAESEVLVIGTEGATDPMIYKTIVEQNPSL